MDWGPASRGQRECPDPAPRSECASRNAVEAKRPIRVPVRREAVHGRAFPISFWVAVNPLRCAVRAARKPGVAIHGHPSNACVGPREAAGNTCDAFAVRASLQAWVRRPWRTRWRIRRAHVLHAPGREWEGPYTGLSERNASCFARPGTRLGRPVLDRGARRSRGLPMECARNAGADCNR